ncbi:hydrolase 1, exosortase A system-associated [Alteraurantiacibacter buctensis]|uniref:Hydrolase 1, exosortase A system-associated n=1 Tax=Alteraurantiacibacter buctensis TaxID=1503981 RepID=A0A844YZ78_9SPHN|nr:hydrolase 1, exosortase A system-associated [Alteraurantiacibacter buctensis]MXO72336.1 hydrolase 1, exosortase A system-associated [Alteraurantiacibacter buctensis]
MTRRHLTFHCEGDILAATLDEASGTDGLLIVSGGNETRAGAFSGQSHLAARIAAKGYPVLRFDRRGVGDSSGQNRGFRESREDILAALAAFRDQCPNVSRIVAFGNCDAASALMLMRGDGCDALVLSNPWTFEDEADDAYALPPPEAIRARYWAKLRNPAEWLRLLRGQVNLSRLRQGLGAAAARSAGPTGLAQEMAKGLDGATKPYAILIAGNDRTGLAFDRFWTTHGNLQQGPVYRCPGASHAYLEPHAAEWLEAQVMAMLQG